jgi:hypothetical protein
MAISADQTAGLIGISLILLMLVHRLVSENIPKGRFLRMSLIWLGIVVFITVVAVAFQHR